MPNRPAKDSRAKCQAKLGLLANRKRRRGDGLRMRSCWRDWNEEGWKDVPCRRKSCKTYMNARHKGKGVKCAKEKKKVKGWSTEEMKGKPSSSLEEDTEEMIKWRGMSQGVMDQCWKNLAERMEEEVLDKYKVEDSKREAFTGRSALLEWRRERRSKKYRIRRIFALFREYNLQRLQSKHEELHKIMKPTAHGEEEHRS